ncbi:MAG TPA: SMC family ATPase [Nocardioides sp.]|nr:SMC family ATPase [Nocardioides sp.]
MRLHHLSVTAFGPFVDTAEVDFDTLSDAGLFLLSGATGAGKSSVLDAVCFALYGAVPGDRQHAGRLRSDQAPAGLAPRVEADVTLAGRRFRLVRSPAWDRPKKRGLGTTREPAKVTLSEHVDGAWVHLSSRLDETGDLVAGLLGMNLDQFCQVAMLPQGHFQAFLRADSAQRHQLLARLFRTGRFERVEGWLREHRLALRRTSEAHRQVVADLVSRVSEAADAEVPEALAEVAEAADDGSLLSWTVALRDGATARSAEAAAEAAALVAAETATRTTWQEAREQAVAHTRVVEAAAALERLTERAGAHAAEVERLERARRAESLRPLVALVDDRHDALAAARAAATRALEAVGPLSPGSSLAAELESLGDDLAGLTALLPAERRLTGLRAEEARRREALRSLTEDDRLEEAEAVAVAARTAQLTEALTEAEEAVLALPATTAERERWAAVVAAHTDLARLEAELALLTVDHQAALHRVLDLREHLLDLRERRIAGMAAELAGSLAVGDDCPVCGSCEHPHLAVAAEGHPDGDAERTAQRALDDAQAAEAAVAMRVREVTQAVAGARSATAGLDVAAARSALAEAESRHRATAALAGGRDALATETAEVRARAAALAEAAAGRRVRTAEETTALTHLEAQLRDLEAQVAEARGEHPALAVAVERLEARRTVLRAGQAAAASCASAETALADATVALGRAALEAGFDDPDTARAAALPPDDVARLDRSVRAHESALAAARSVLAEPGAEELLAVPEPDLASLERAHRASAEALQTARARVQVAARLHARLVDLHCELSAALTAWAPVRHDLALATRVASFAEGKSADNRLQMRLSAYVLAHRLSQVVAAANARLAGMSDQRYSLEHVGRRGAGETRGGLSLVVRDDWSGESRDPATLSGGETFVVSLALALGLADVVAHEAGGADLQTLFVDEGFGSLDAETLDDVLDILDTLRENGRAVGVVSHVAEMRHRIPTQLVVTKARSGSTVRVRG